MFSGFVKARFSQNRQPPVRNGPDSGGVRFHESIIESLGSKRNPQSTFLSQYATLSLKHYGAAKASSLSQELRLADTSTSKKEMFISQIADCRTTGSGTLATCGNTSRIG
uniref:Uncharacterized protein n=1 Tax=Anguilla anguilla TaxID=7936 RepID=A0A0E9X956_ANGAN